MNNRALQVGEEINFRRKYKNIPEILEVLVNEFPDRGSTYIAPSGHEECITYKEMKAVALQYLYTLQQAGVKAGDVVMVETTNPKEFHLLFWTCMFGGMIIAPLSQPTSWVEGSEGVEVLRRLWAKLDKPIIITQEEHGRYYEAIQEMEGFEKISYMTVGQLVTTDMGKRHERAPDDVAYIQFSSGTTGDPQGAMLTHNNILCACTSTAHGLKIDDEGVLFSWLPHTHNLGTFVPFIIGMMQANNMYYMTPATFVSNPYLFVKKLSQHNGSWFCINNFGLSWMANQVSDEQLEGIDLSAMQYIFPGAENISKSVIDNFYSKFEKCGMDKGVIRPGYGLTEATIAVSLTPVGVGNAVQVISRKELLSNNRAVLVEEGNEQEGVSFTSNGSPLPGVTIRIADENGDTVDEDCIGEIQLQCKSIYIGYYGETAKERSNVKDGWLCTGDLGYYHDGMLFIVGRKKDIIIIRGINYMVTDLEDIIYKHVDIPRGMLAITGVMNQDKQEEPVVFVQYRGELEDFVPFKKAICKSINEEIGLNVQQVIPLKSIVKTSSGKIKRYLMKMQYESGMYKEIVDQLARLCNETITIQKEMVLPENPLQAYIRECWAQVLSIDASKISIEDSFTALGGQSVQAYQMISKISAYIKEELGHDMIATCKTIKDIEAYINKQLSKDVKKVEDKPEQEHPKSLSQKQKVAITGIAFKMPGANDQDTLWHNLCNEKSSIAQVSEKRKALASVEKWEDWIGEVEDIDSFDYDFFEITQEEAQFMDPQQRLVMEVAYEALADAGMIVDSGMHEKCVGVYAGISANTYYTLVCDYIREHGMKDVHPKTLVGNMSNIISAHISHQYNFTGPVMAIDSACSSYMTALHYGAQAIADAKIEGAVIIGSNIIATPFMTELAKKAGIISTTNLSKVFDKDADGSLLGEGVVVIYMESLEKAQQDYKHIYGVIEGSAINNDGFALSVMAPNPKGQFKVIEQAYSNARIQPEQVSYIEAHGTGTKIGDPIEINALSRVFKGCKDRDEKIGIGSVKTNIGHLLSAAGGAALMKVLMCMKNKKLVPSLNMENVNPLLEIDKTPFEVVTDLIEWKPAVGNQRMAGITSLGLGGTNAHVIISEWKSKQVINEHKCHLLTVSAKTEEALSRAIERMSSYVGAQEDKLSDICFTANRYRRHYQYRAACVMDETDWQRGRLIWQKHLTGKMSRVNLYIGDLSKACKASGCELWSKLLIALQKLTAKEIRVYTKASNQLLYEALKDETHIKVSCSSSELEQAIALKETFVGIEMSASEQALLTQNGAKLVYMTACGEEDEKLLLRVVQQMYLMGMDIKWKVLYPNGTGQLVNLPAYPFQKNSVWINQ